MHIQFQWIQNKSRLEEKRRKQEDSHILIFETYYRVTRIKTVGVGIKTHYRIMK